MRAAAMQLPAFMADCFSRAALVKFSDCQRLHSEI
jgi:hypothetical protein